MHISEDLSLFIGLTTVPHGKEKEFFESDIEEGIFKNYKDIMIKGGLEENDKEKKSQSLKELKKYLYKPKAYALFGNFDLAILSLIDDYTLGSRSFHPYSYLIGHDNDKKETQPFNYQVFTGPGIKIFSSLEEENLLSKAKKTFLKAEAINKLPFIGIASFKVNNSLLLGAGGVAFQLVELAIHGTVQSLIATRTKGDSQINLEYILTESYGWHELTIVFFSDNYKHISDSILRLRELRFGQLEKFSRYELERRKKIIEEKISAVKGKNRNEKIQPLKRELETIEKYLNEFISGNINYIKEKSFIGKCIKSSSNKDLANSDIDLTHLFVNSYTIFGIERDIFTNGKVKKDYTQQIARSGLSLFSRWHTKPGHLAPSVELHLKNAPSELKKEESIQMIFGAGDFALPKTASSMTDVVAVNAQLSDSKQEHEYLSLHSHIRRINSVPLVTYNYKDVYRELKKEDFWVPLEKCIKHPFLTRELKNYAFSLSEIKKIRAKLFSIKCSKILREKTLNMFGNFNDGIQDVVLYAYFIEMRPYLERIKKLITEEYSKKDGDYGVKHLNEIQNEFDILVDHFDKAFKNRFHQSYRMNEITDFNMEHNGGIQQVVSSFDAAYKSLTKVMGEDEGSVSFAMVSGMSGIDSSLFHVRLNSFHIFFPSLFVAVIVKEAANKFLQKKDFSDNKYMLEQVNRIEKFKNNLATKGKKEAWISEILQKHYRDDHFKYGKFELAEILSWLSPESVDYFVADALAYGYGYPNKSELFTYWQWNYAMQLTEEYDKDGNFNEQSFIKLMIRFVFLGHCFNDFKDAHEQNIVCPNPLLNNYWFQYKDKIVEAFKLIKSELAADIVDPINALITHVIDRSLRLNDTDKLETHTAIVSNFMDRQADARDKNKVTSEPMLQKWNTLVLELSEKAKRRLKEGKIFYYNEESGLPAQQYLISLFMAYLEMIHELNKEYPDKLHVIIRKEVVAHSKSESNEVPKNAGKYVPMAFDSMGGFFTTDATVRRNFFQYRSAFIKSLYDFALKTKIDLLQKNDN